MKRWLQAIGIAVLALAARLMTEDGRLNGD
jgi:hypothetical protein